MPADPIDNFPERPRMTLAGFALDQRVLMNLLFFVMILAGALVIDLMPVDVYPDVDMDEATIDTFWPGASAEDIERLITDKIEAQIEDVRGVSRMTSDSKPDASHIRVKFREDLSPTEFDAAFRQLRAAVDRVVDLPIEAEKPLVTQISLSELFPLVWVVVEDIGGIGEEVLHDVALKLKPILRDIPGVAKVDDKLLRDRELHVLVDRETIRRLDLTLDEVAGVLAEYNRTVPSGTLAEARGEYSVRAVGEVPTPEEFGDIAVRKDHRGGHVYLRDIARTVEGFERQHFFARLNGHGGKAIGVSKTQEADSRQVAERVRETIRKFHEGLPPGVRSAVGVATCLDSSDIIHSRIRILLSNLGQGMVLVFAMLWVTVGLRNSILAIIGIPFSFMCALIFMHLFGVTINAVSLFAMVLCSGMDVDDAIVVLENIYRHVENSRLHALHGAERERALRRVIIRGAQEVMWPVVFSTLTTVAAFMPLLLMSGVTGKFFAIIPKTVAVVLLASLIQCLIMLPVHYYTFGPRGVRRSSKRGAGAADDELAIPQGSILGLILRVYDRILAGVLRYRYIAALPLFGLGFLTWAVAPLLKVNLFPSDYQLAIVDVKAWDEASLDQTGEVVAPLEKIVTSLGPQYVQSVLATFGITGTDDNVVKWRNNLAQLHIQLADTDAVNADPDAVSARIREEIQQYVDAHPDCGVESFRVWAPQDGPPIGKPVAIQIESANLGSAKRLAERYKRSLASMAGVYGIIDDLDFGPKQINLRLNEDLASAHGLTQTHLARALRTANDGLVISTFKDKRTGEDLDVRVMFAEAYRRDLRDLLDINLRTPGGYAVQLGDICELDMSQGYAGIPHYNAKRVVTVSAEVDTAVTSAHAVNSRIAREFESVLATVPDMRITYGGQFQETTESFNSLYRAYAVAMIVIYMLLATQFRSYAQPFVILLTVPFACVGVVAGLLLSDYPFTIMTFIAIVGLTGVVVNDSIVLVDFLNIRLAAGVPTEQAIREACRLRFRAVMLTTITTVLGLLPMALGWGGTSKIWSPFASSFAWGLTFSTLVTMLVEPAFYHIIQDVIAFRRRRREARESGREPASAISGAG